MTANAEKLDHSYCCCLGIAPRAQLLKKSIWLLFTYLVTRLQLSHAIVVRLYVRKINVVILTPETAGTAGV